MPAVRVTSVKRTAPAAVFPAAETAAPRLAPGFRQLESKIEQRSSRKRRGESEGISRKPWGPAPRFAPPPSARKKAKARKKASAKGRRERRREVRTELKQRHGKHRFFPPSFSCLRPLRAFAPGEFRVFAPFALSRRKTLPGLAPTAIRARPGC